MKKKLVITALLSAVSGATMLATPSVASEKKIECVRKIPGELYTQFPLKYQKECDIPLGLTAPEETPAEPIDGGGSSPYTS